MIKNIVFDIGDVLVTYKPEKYVEKLKMSQMNVVKANDILVTDKSWRDYLNGNITIDKILQHLIKEHSELEQEFRILLEKQHSQNIFHEIEPNVQLLKELAKNYNIYLLSNITKETLEVIQEKFAFAQYIKGGVYSCIEHVSKPDKRIYQTLLKQYHLNATETLFIDDKKKNIEMAEGMGMIGIQYKENKSLRDVIGGILD